MSVFLFELLEVEHLHVLSNEVFKLVSQCVLHINLMLQILNLIRLLLVLLLVLLNNVEEEVFFALKLQHCPILHHKSCVLCRDVFNDILIVLQLLLVGGLQLGELPDLDDLLAELLEP